MGGKPFLALNVAALPDNLPSEISSEIIRGGAEKAREAGVVIAGGHTVKDKEPKYGLVVIGFVHPQKMLSKGGLQGRRRAGADQTARLRRDDHRAQTASRLPRQMCWKPSDWMKRLNDKAGQLANEFDLRGGTDITGFSFLGHGHGDGGRIRRGAELQICKDPVHLLRDANMPKRDASPAARSITRVYFGGKGQVRGND
ncbi:MAG: AIR synthase related protein [Candidatus Moduliflexus flocculans]|nr:AIR synthase related protein [Candidatus Moduliflexus flocculans]